MLLFYNFKIRQQAASDTLVNQDLNTLNQGSKNSVNPVLNNVNLTLSSNQDPANREGGRKTYCPIKTEEGQK
jgi:hypothetical protein